MGSGASSETQQPKTNDVSKDIIETKDSFMRTVDDDEEEEDEVKLSYPEYKRNDVSKIETKDSFMQTNNNVVIVDYSEYKRFEEENKILRALIAVQNTENVEARKALDDAQKALAYENIKSASKIAALEKMFTLVLETKCRSMPCPSRRRASF